MNINSHTILNTESYYSDLYDRHTVESCRQIIRFNQEKLPIPEGKSFSKKEQRRAKVAAAKLMLLFESGERWLHKKERIQEWMAADKEKDDLYNNARAPQGINCLKCGSLMKPTLKDLWLDSNEKDKVLFMYDCPNGCLPRRAFFQDGQEWKAEKHSCPKCNTFLEVKEEDTEQKFIAIYNCPRCEYSKTDEIERSHFKEWKPDKNFVRDRKRFCLSEEAGQEYLQQKLNLEQMAQLGKEIQEREKNNELYDKVAKLKKITVVELQNLLAPILEEAGYIKLELAKPEIGREVTVEFNTQDAKSGRIEYDSKHDLQRLLKQSLADTNWRLMSDGISYRLGFLSGRFRGYEREDELLKLFQKDVVKTPSRQTVDNSDFAKDRL